MTTPDFTLAQGAMPLHGVNGSAIIDPRTAQTNAATESYLFGVAVPANSVTATRVLRVTMWGQMSSTGVLNVRLRAGAATAATATDANVLHTLTFPAATTTNQWIRYEGFVTIASVGATDLVVTGIGHGWTGTTVVSPANAVVEKMITLPKANPWSVSLSAASGTSASVFRVRHAAVNAL